MKKRIEIEIKNDGTILAETIGIKGRKCIDYIELLEEILEAEAVDSDFKPEYYEKETIRDTTMTKQNIKKEY